MIPAIVTAGCVLLAGLILALRYFMQQLRARGQAAIDERYPPADLLLSDTLAQSYGQQSRGVTQARGNGALVLTPTELFFLLYVPERALQIPLADIESVSIVRRHLGKAGGAKLLHVAFTHEGEPDSIAWRLPDPDGWKAKIDPLLSPRPE